MPTSAGPFPLFVRRPDPDRVGWLPGHEYAHRGLHGCVDGVRVVENSLAAFALAIERNMGIECDIQRSRDGEAMLLHDWELDRLTGVSGQTDSYDAAELARIAFINSDHRIARLSDLLDLVAGRVPILIEIKSRARYDVKRSCAAVARSLQGYRGAVAVMSFDPRVSRWFARHYPAPVRGLVMKETPDGPTPRPWQRRLALAHARPEFLAYDIRALPNRLVAAVKARGVPLATWTVNTPERRARALIHADALICEGEGLA